jgi:HK97 family phage major capsid protein
MLDNKSQATDKTELYRVKVQLPDGIVERETTEADKRMKADGEYLETGWRVLGVPYGGPVKGRDLDGEAFTDETDIWLKIGDQVNITYYHGFDAEKQGEKQAIPALIGKATYVAKDERGHWFEPVLDGSEPLAQRLMKAGIETLRASSGAVNHLVRKAAGGLISVWPVGELALFDTNEWRKPANDFAVIEAKAEVFTEAVTEAEKSAVDAVEDEVVAQTETIKSTIPMEENTMDEEKIVEEVKAVEPKLDVEALKKSIIDELKAAPGEVKGAPTVKNAKESPSFVKAMLAWAQGDNPRGFKGNDITMGMKANPWEGGEDTEGGYAVPDDFYNRIVEQRQELSWVRQAPVTRFVVNHDRILIPTEGTAATKLVITDEEAAYNENEPLFGQVALTMYKFTKMLKISEEMLDGDAVGLEAYIASVVARASAAAENYYCTTSDGSGKPQGIINGATASGITNAAKATILASEVIATMGTVASPYHNANSGFLMTGASKFHVMASTGNNFQFIPTPSGGDILGYPIYIAPDMDTVGSTSGKAVLFGDFSMYAFGERQGLTLSRNPYVYQANGQIGLFVKQRFGGAVLQTLALKYLTLSS